MATPLLPHLLDSPTDSPKPIVNMDSPKPTWRDIRFFFFGDKIPSLHKKKCKLLLTKPRNVLLEIDNSLVSFWQEKVFCFVNSFLFAQNLYCFLLYCNLKLCFRILYLFVSKFGFNVSKLTPVDKNKLLFYQNLGI